MKLPKADWQKREGMTRLLALLGAEEGDTRYVGGCVRDTLLDLPVNDVDLATRLTPQEVIKRLESGGIKAVPTGIAHGTVTAILHGRPVEVTTLRRDLATDGRRATIAYTDDWREDAARRDFTINALSANPVRGELFDYFGGAEDLAAGRVRFIGDPLTRIAEDHLRILRYFRFHARFGRRDPDEASLEACTARANDLMALSRERIADELLKLLSFVDPSPTLRLMIERGILSPVLPEIDKGGAARLALLPNREAAAGVPPDPIRRLSALLPCNQNLAANVSARLRLSKKLRLRLICIEHRATSQSLRSHNPKALAYEYGLPCAIDWILLEKELNAQEAADRIRLLEGWSRPQLPVTGGMLIAKGLREGPIVAKTLRAIETDWVDQGFPDAKDLTEIVEAQVDQALRSSQ